MGEWLKEGHQETCSQITPQEHDSRLLDCPFHSVLPPKISVPNWSTLLKDERGRDGLLLFRNLLQFCNASMN
uniref:Uncharacterized protein n=1 Tax=Steinernema glaseri TaxID=37863 RepID=A0A1I7XZK6_9BILA